MLLEPVSLQARTVGGVRDFSVKGEEKEETASTGGFHPKQRFRRRDHPPRGRQDIVGFR